MFQFVDLSELDVLNDFDKDGGPLGKAGDTGPGDLCGGGCGRGGDWCGFNCETL